MKSVVSGVAGAVRIRQLTLAGLTRAEGHGKRQEETGKARAINDEPAITTDGLDIKSLYASHVDGAFVPRSGSKAMHVIVQFPKELVDGGAADHMLHHAREFGKRVFGDEAIFADRIDRDEKSQHVVDLFVAPKYLKVTKHEQKVAVSMTRHLKALAKEHGHQPHPFGIGRALQDAWFEYLRDEMRLETVQRGSPKQVAGSDWKSAEQLRAEELEQWQQRLNERETQLNDQQIAGWARLASFTSDAEEDASKIRSEAESDAKATREEAELASERIREAAKREGLEQGLAAARDQVKSERDEVAAKNRAAEKDRDAAAAQLATATAQRTSSEAESLALREELSYRSAALDRREKALAEKEREAAQANAAATALQVGIQAWTVGDIVGTDCQTFIFRDDEAKHRILPGILAAWNELYESVTVLASRAAAKAASIEADAKQKADQLIEAAAVAKAEASALKAGIRAWVDGDIQGAVLSADGRRRICWRNSDTKLNLRPSIAAAWGDVWEAVAALASRVAEKVSLIETQSRQEARGLVTDAALAASAFLQSFKSADEAERDVLRGTKMSGAVSSFVSNPTVQAALQGSSDDQDFDELLLEAAAAGLLKGVKAPAAIQRR